MMDKVFDQDVDALIEAMKTREMTVTDRALILAISTGRSELAEQAKLIADQEELNRILALDVNKKELQIEDANHEALKQTALADDISDLHCKAIEQIEAMQSAFILLTQKLENEMANIGAVDGYDYNSGVEYGLRSASLLVDRQIARLKALALDKGDV